MTKPSLWRTKSLDHILHDTEQSSISGNSLKRTLGVRDLTAFGIAAIIGAGIFSTIGNAAASGGPAISVLFIFTAIACGFSALCYAEFASTVPVSGSAYTYAYFTLGEIIAWIIGWDLLLEYAIGNIACAISWSDYFTEFVKGFGWYFPEFLSMDYFSASRAHQIMSLSPDSSLITESIINANAAWNSAPSVGGIRIIADLPALFIVFVITYIVFIGIRESRTVNNIMVAIKLLVVFGVIVTGSFYVHPDNWSPFAPEGVAGVLKGVSAVFFAFIGFDAISTTAEECKNPSRDLPRSIFYALSICTVLYVLVALVLTGMVNYQDLAVGDPLSYVFKKVGLEWFSGIVAFTALIAMGGVILIFQLGQPRIWMSMSRDGLLPKVFSKIHPKYRTPSFSTIITGIVVAVPALFMNLTEVTDLTSIGTLFAFVVVCGGVLVLQQRGNKKAKGKYQVPYLNGKYWFPIIFIIAIVTNWLYNKPYWIDFFTGNETSFVEKIPMLLFLAVSAAIAWLSYRKSLSLIPVLGLVSCLFLMTKLGYTNWLRFLIWLGIGLVVYFAFGRKNSKLNTAIKTPYIQEQ
jgi:amino acid transporter